MSWRSTRATGGVDHDVRQVAVIDLGSNSWRAVVYMYGGNRLAAAAIALAGAETHPANQMALAGGVPGGAKPPRVWWKLTDEIFETVRIGAGLAETGRLSDAGMGRGLETLAVFERFCAAHGLGPDAVHAVATSAIRDASNGERFLKAARAAGGLNIEVISDEDEARFGYVAAINSSTMTDGLVLETGGGSIQLIKIVDRRAELLRSFPLGAVRITEGLLRGSGPAKKKDLQRVRAHVRDALSDYPPLAGAGKRIVGMGGAARNLPGAAERIVGMGGAVRNLAAAAQRMADQPDIGVQGFVITREMLAELVQTLAALPVAERGEVPGIKVGRGDIILASALVIETVVELGKFAGIEVTEASLRDGVFLAREFLADEPEPLFDDVRGAGVRNLATQYESDLPHVAHVAQLSLQMFDSLAGAGLLQPRPGERELLWAAAMLHDVGMTISYDDHHKHSYYLIVSAGLPGFDPRERALIAQISRYHRKGAAKLGELAALARPGDEQLLDRCSVILRLAEHLERGRDQSVREARLRANGRGVDLHLEAAGDLTLPRWSVERYGDDEAFQRVFGRRLLIG
ncbi:MAG: Ppx/GppA family phosphatase [Solirubrobacterales bacterium]|nr:Ppx/GppA family phosphatase [Solirubrobacterales bacterium]